ncbi:hypothetical protein HDK90DRAFT_180416 [Phyllosticta capitalensis]|uniref:Uncharacterized protein n=1 Tax=Phyllosticta capitalensis TaxID=121624 RepID=A0ABR1YW31_9PEZI
MFSPRSTFVAAGVLLLSAGGALADCVSYGIDFQNGGQYFINKALTQNFSSVSQFEGCSAGYSDVLLVDPKGDEYVCTDIPVTPDDVSQLSTCPILKSQMFSGEWKLLLLGNNGPMNASFAYERDLYLTVGEQVTSTITSTITWNYTTTPIITTTVPSTILVTSTAQNNQTITLPSATARKTITPPAVTSTLTKFFTRTRQSFTKSLTIVTETKTASCTVPPKPNQPDPKATFVPTKPKFAAFASLIAVQAQSSDTPADPVEVRRRMREARLRRGMEVPDRLQEHRARKRSPDSSTVFVNADTVANTTITFTAPATTTTEYELTTLTSTTTLPPKTVLSGKETIFITAPTPTKTRTRLAYTTVTKITTLYKTFTFTTTVTPTASVSACKHRGGHFPGH